MEPTSRSAKGRDFATVIAVLPGLPECPSISPSHRTSHRTCGRGRAASNAERCPRECFQKLTGCPFCCGVRGHREMNRTSPVLIENHKHEQELERNRWDNEEICRNRVLGVIFEKGSP